MCCIRHHAFHPHGQVQCLGIGRSRHDPPEPNIPATLSGSYAVNDICPGGSNLTGNLFLARDFAQLEYQYRINDGTVVTVFFGDLDVVLPIGENTITYLIRDCAGNRDSCNL